MSPHRLDGIVFDLDATLVNLGGFVDWKKAQAEIVENYLEHECDPSIVNECSKKGLFNMLEEMYDILLKERGLENTLTIQQSAYDILSHYEKKGADSCTLMDGCPDILEWLKEKEIPIGICTSNSPNSAETALKLQGIRDYFQVVVGRKVDTPMKPHPAQLRRCFELICVDPKSGMMVGDSHKDIIAGKELGSYTIGIPVHYTRLDLMKEAGVDQIIENLCELKEIIESF